MTTTTMSSVDRILAGIARHEALAQAATAGPWSSYFGRVRRNDKTDLLLVTTAGRYSDSAYVAANNPVHVLAVLAAAREELVGAVQQQERHRRSGIGPFAAGPAGESGAGAECVSGDQYPCADAEQAARTLTRLAALYADRS